MLWNEGVFDRARKRRLSAEHEQQSQREHKIPAQQGRGSAEHRNEFGGFEDLQQSRAFEAICELAGGSREQKERRDQRSAGDCGQRPGIGAGRGAVDDHHDKGALEQIVVKRPEDLGQEQRQETPSLEQFDLLAHRSVPWFFDRCPDPLDDLVRGVG